MFDIKEFQEYLKNKYNIDSLEVYESILKDCLNKELKLNDLEYQDIIDKYGIKIHYDSLRKSQQTPFGAVAVTQYLEHKYKNTEKQSVADELDEKLSAIRKERIKLQTANVERTRLDRNEARQQYYYEQVGSVATSLPLPEFKTIPLDESDSIEYLVAITDIHYGAYFKSENNEYSPKIAQERFEYLACRLIDFIQKKKITKLHIATLGDILQGILRVNDLKINESSVVKATVEISRIIAMFLREISKYTNVEYYHVPSANHTQLRLLNTKANQLAEEDLEYVISNYIKDLSKGNERINVHLSDENKPYIEIPIFDYDIIAMHGHQIRNIESAIKDLSLIRKSLVDYLILGHYHSGKEIPSYEGVCHDAEILICPSFVGSDPYSDSLMKGTKAAVKIYGFSDIYGHTETHKIILN